MPWVPLLPPIRAPAAEPGGECRRRKGRCGHSSAGGPTPLANGSPVPRKPPIAFLAALEARVLTDRSGDCTIALDKLGGDENAGKQNLFRCRSGTSHLRRARERRRGGQDRTGWGDGDARVARRWASEEIRSVAQSAEAGQEGSRFLGPGHQLRSAARLSATSGVTAGARCYARPFLGSVVAIVGYRSNRTASVTGKNHAAPPLKAGPGGSCTRWS